MATKKSFIELIHDEGYGDDLLFHVTAALRGKDMRVLSIADGDLLGAAEQAYGALVGASPRPDSVQGEAKARLKVALGYGK